MDIDTHVNQIVQNIVAEITTKVQSQALDAINQKVSEVVNAIDCTSMIADNLNQLLAQKINQLPIDAQSIESAMQLRVENLAQNLYNEVKQKSITITTENINQFVKQIDFRELSEHTLLSALENQTFRYPADSIPAGAVDKTNFVLSGNNIDSGIIKNFGSTGIDDKATQCQLSIFDETTVVENNLLTKDLTVKGTINVEGDLNVSGTIPESSPLFNNVVAAATRNVCGDTAVFDSFLTKTLAKINTDGVDLKQITIGGQVAVDGNTLGGFIVNSNLQKVGQLKELQVAGETLLGDTLYVSAKRTGINTYEPAQALSVWDQEIEIGFGKQSNNVAVIGTPRPQTLVISSNNKDNLTLTPDGAVAVNQLSIGTISIGVSNIPPTSNQPRGTIVLNSTPNLGGPIGWVSLGDARWGNFGIID